MSKQIDVKMHFIRDVITQGAIVVKKNPYNGQSYKYDDYVHALL